MRTVYQDEGIVQSDMDEWDSKQVFFLETTLENHGQMELQAAIAPYIGKKFRMTIEIED
jgi:hypothetical protein